jgi:hypothetical protein
LPLRMSKYLALHGGGVLNTLRGQALPPHSSHQKM